MSNSSQPHDLVLGDLVVAAYDRANSVTSDPEVATLLAARTMGRWLARTQRLDLIRQWGASNSGPDKLPPRRAARATRPRHKRAA
jgi:hypothetical protein